MFRAYFDHFLRHIVVHICRLFTAYLPKPSYESMMALLSIILFVTTDIYENVKIR
jgi:hypothetical protein